MKVKLNISVEGEVRWAEWDFLGDTDVDISVFVHLCVSLLLGLLQVTHLELQVVIWLLSVLI